MPVTTNLLFSFPKNFDEKIKIIVFGITAKLRIGIISTELTNCGKNIGIIFGPKIIPIIDIVVEINNIIILNLFEFLPAESSTNKNLNDILAKRFITKYTWNAKANSPNISNPNIGTINILSKLRLKIVDLEQDIYLLNKKK